MRLKTIARMPCLVVGNRCKAVNDAAVAIALQRGLARALRAKGCSLVAISGDDPCRRVLCQHNAVRAKQSQPIPQKTGTRLAPGQLRKQKSQQALTC
jgi:hypothetical protein